MKKKLLSVLLSTAMVASLLVGCGDKEETVETPAEETAPAEDETSAEETAEAPAEEAAAEWTADFSDDTGSVLNIYCWNTEFQSRMKDHYPGYTDNGDGTGTIGDVTVNWVIVPSDDMAYQNNLDETLLGQADAAADDKIDMFLIEADYALKYVNAEGVCISMDELGLTDYMADQYQYTKDVVTDGNGNVNGTSWQACPGLYIYRRSVAKEVFGSDDPADVQEHFSDWDKFAESAQELADAGWKVVSGYDDAYRVFSQNVSTPWVVDGKIVVDDNIKAWVDQTKDFTDKGFNNKTSLWSDDWSKGASSTGDVFGYFGPAWFIDFCLAGYTLDDAEGEAAVGNGCWGDWAAIEGPQGYFWGGTWVCAAQGSDNTGLVADIMYQLTCNPDVMKDIVTADNDFCNNQPLMEEMAAAGTTSDFLGGENVLEKFCAGVQTISMENSTIYDQGMTEQFQGAMKDYFDGNVDYDTALQNFYTNIETRYPELTH
ncbi:MAG: carbohydrate ABC transporter substrate-binding protein [Lachnospiraceae bacterium]